MRVSFFIIVSLGLILSGCSASYHIKKAEQKCPDCFKRDTVINTITIKRDTLIKIDTTILITFNTDTVYKDTTIKKLKPYSFKPIFVENGIINAKVSLRKGVLSVATWLDSTMLYHYEDEILVRDALITHLEQKVIKQEVTITEQRTLIERFKSTFNWLKYVLLVIVVLIIAGISYKFIKWLKK